MTVTTKTIIRKLCPSSVIASEPAKGMTAEVRFSSAAKSGEKEATARAIKIVELKTAKKKAAEEPAAVEAPAVEATKK